MSVVSAVAAFCGEAIGKPRGVSLLDQGLWHLKCPKASH